MLRHKSVNELGNAVGAVSAHSKEVGLLSTWQMQCAYKLAGGL